MENDVELREILSVKTGKFDANHSAKDGKYTFFTCADVPSKANTFSFDDEVLILPGNGANVGKVYHYKGKLEAYQRTYVLYKIKAFPRFLYYYFSKFWIRQITKKQVGTATNYIKMDDILSFKIPLPPLEEQKRIAKILDDAQALKQKTEKLIQEYNSLAQSIFLDMFGDPVTNKCFNIKPVCYYIDNLDTGKSVNSTNEKYTKDKMGILKTSCVYNGVFEPMESKVIRKDELEKAKLNPKKDSIIISRMNTEELVGKSAYIQNNYPNIYLPDRLWQTTKNNNEHSVLWLSYAIKQKSFLQKISQIATGTSGSMKNISKSKFLQLPIITPPLELQNQFAEKIALIEKQKEIAQKELTETENLFNCLLQKAFKGRSK